MENQSELKTDVLKHGMRVRLTIDMPDDIFPLFKGDEGVIYDNALLGGSEGWLGFKSDRYASHDATHVSRKNEYGRTYRIVDFCEPSDDVKDGLYPVVSLLVGAKYILEPLTHNNGCFRADFSLLVACLTFIKNEVKGWDEKTTRKLVKRLENLIDEFEQSVIISESTLSESQKDSLARVEDLLCTTWELCLENRLSEELRAPAITEDCHGALKALKEAESPAPRPEPLPLGTQVIMNNGVFAGWNHIKAVIQSFEDMGDGAVIYCVKASDSLHAMVTSSAFEIDQAWAIENEESAIFGDGQS